MVKQQFEERIEKSQGVINELEKQLSSLSMGRVAAFIGSAVLIVILANQQLLSSLLFVVPGAIWLYASLTQRFQKLAREKKHHEYIVKLNQQETERLEGKLKDIAHGSGFLEANHPFASDLDIFGDHSLYQLLNRTTTESGGNLLAKWLTTPADSEVLDQRQESIRELSKQLEWRQNFQASGMPHVNAKSDYQQLLSWAKSPVKLLDKKRKYMTLSLVLAALTTAACLYFFFNAYQPQWYLYILPMIAFALVNSRVIKSVRDIADEIIDSTHKNVKTLSGYHSLINHITTAQFDSPLLVDLQSMLKNESGDAESAIKKLRKILEVFQLRGTKLDMFGGNKFYPFINLLWLVDIHWILQTEAWKVKHGEHLKQWVDSISAFEVLNSLAGYHHANPDYAFAAIAEEPYQIHFENLGHPLISAEKRVCNDFTMSQQGEIAMITGSNMAGKSTFLRTVGINLVLALSGAPCCAKSGQVSHMKLFTSMRTQDNLEEGVSSFYAELQRIELLLKEIERGEPIFFLLDEMFKGTNSQDRYKGGISLIKQLNELNAFGMISTHDLELAKLSVNQVTATNYSFNSQIIDGEMTFDYTLTPGICEDFNASELMRRSGIKIIEGLTQLPD